MIVMDSKAQLCVDISAGDARRMWLRNNMNTTALRVERSQALQQSTNHSQLNNGLICFLRQSRSVIRPTVSLGNHTTTAYGIVLKPLRYLAHFN